MSQFTFTRRLGTMKYSCDVTAITTILVNEELVPLLKRYFKDCFVK